MLRQLRFHGRGGEGVKLAGRITSRAAFLAGLAAQDSPLYGAERRGAPVVTSVRAGDPPLLDRGYVVEPDVIVVLDASLLADGRGPILEGDAAAVLVNSSEASPRLKADLGIGTEVVCMDVSSLVLARLGEHHLSAPMAGWAIRALDLAGWECVAAAVRIELAAIGVPALSIERNLEATRIAFDAATVLPPRRRAAPERPCTTPFVVVRLPVTMAAPTVDVGANSELRTTGGWRTHRPVIDRAHCNRCFLCFVLCPEGSIHLDAQHFPLVDYDHCKGCMVCAAECPTHTIREEREVAP